MMRQTPFNNEDAQAGFTLIEIILSLVLCGILAAMIAVYTSTVLSRSGTIGEDLRDTLKIYSIMERVRLHYQSDPDLTLATLKSNIDSNTYDDDTGDTYLYNVIHNDYVQCDASSTSTFTTDTGCNPATEDCLLLVILSDPDRTGIRTTSLFTE